MVQTSASFRRDAQDVDGSISLSEIISALSYALDLTEGAVHGHALRSCLLGMRIAHDARLPIEQTSGLYFALLLKDIGGRSIVSRIGEVDNHANQANRSKLKTFWKNVLPAGFLQTKNERQKVGLRYERGASIVTKLGMGPFAAETVRCMDERWDGGGYPDSIKGEQIPLLARIGAVAQHLDIFSAANGTQNAIKTLQERSGTWFDPHFVRIALSLHRRGTLVRDRRLARGARHADFRSAQLPAAHQGRQGGVDRRPSSVPPPQRSARPAQPGQDGRLGAPRQLIAPPGLVLAAAWPTTSRMADHARLGGPQSLDRRLGRSPQTLGQRGPQAACPLSERHRGILEPPAARPLLAAAPVARPESSAAARRKSGTVHHEGHKGHEDAAHVAPLRLVTSG